MSVDRRGINRGWIGSGLVLLLVMVSQVVIAQTNDPFSGGSAFSSDAPIEVNGDYLDYDKTTGRMIARGNVVITQGDDKLEADRVHCNINTGDAYAIGNVVLTRGTTVMRKTRLNYNFKTRKSDADEIEVDAKPFFVQAKKAETAGGGSYILHDAVVTTCTNHHPHCHYHIKAKKLEVAPGDYLKGRSGVWYFGKVPCLYLPYWNKNLNEESGFHFQPGYKSKWGAFLLGAYRQPVTDWLRLEHKFDYRAERGSALGEDVEWRTPGNGKGGISLYYAYDLEPIDDDEDAATADIDNERYRLHFHHKQGFDPRTYMLTQATILSDTDMEEDFFEAEYKASRQPENHIALTHRRDAFTLSALVQMRLNDFYSNVNRLPEVALDVNRIQVGDTTFYYQGQTAGAFLQKVYEDSSTDDEYDAFRLDSQHMVYQPRRIDGWLNVIPRLGYRATWYSKTAEEVSTYDPVTSNTVSSTVDAGADLRSIAEFGTEVSFKAFKMLDQGRMRHVVEPYAEYILSPEPTVKPTELYQFDGVDSLDEVHQLRLGARNKLQVKRQGRPFDVIDLDLYTILHFEDRYDDVLDEIVADAELRPSEWLSVDMDANYSLQESTIQEINTRFSVKRTEWKSSVEHRYRDEDNNLLTMSVTLTPNQEWGMNAYVRYDFEGSRVEEEGGHLQHNWDCISLRLGGSFLPSYTRTDGTENDEEWRVNLEFWLTAFPTFGLQGRTGS